jgi:hypothetical protein
MKYEVGQIIYLLNDKTLKVIPAQICEEVVRNTLSGKEVTYLIQMPDKKRTKANISDIQTQIFTDANMLKSYMLNNAKKMITKLLDDAHKLEKLFISTDNNEIKEYFEAHTKPKKETTKKTKKNDNTEHVQQSKNDDTMVSVDIGNGMKARVRVEDLTNLNLS